jgi:hypothetical protein
VGGAYYWARAYLDTIGEVSIYGPFVSRQDMTQLSKPIDQGVIAYFQRRYRRLSRLSAQGYETISEV